MMRKSLALLPVLAACAAPAGAADIQKYGTTPPGRILIGAEVPPGASIFFVSGQLASPLDPAKPVSSPPTIAEFGDSKTQTISTLNKIKGILAAHGYAMSDIIKMTLFIAPDPKLGKMDFDGVNAGFALFFNTKDNPTTVARSAFQVAALAGPQFLVEIEVTAAKMAK
jgi:enamine deaminase RidA (YjgF/YER057c/UK114 family)